MRDMPLPQLVPGPADRHATMGAFGNFIQHQCVQLRGVLIALQRKDLADYFALPNRDTGSGEIRWLAEVEGTPCRSEQLSVQETPVVHEKLVRTQSAPSAFARSLRALPGAAQASAPMAIRPETLTNGELSILQGLLQVGKARITLYAESPDKVTGSALDVPEFGPDGRVQHHSVERISHGRGETWCSPIASCSGDLSASIESKALRVDLGPSIAEGPNKPTNPRRRFDCSISGKSASDCTTVNHDGHRWQIDLLRIQ
jgi:hypothetical protein